MDQKGKTGKTSLADDRLAKIVKEGNPDILEDHRSVGIKVGHSKVLLLETI